MISGIEQRLLCVRMGALRHEDYRIDGLNMMRILGTYMKSCLIYSKNYTQKLFYNPAS